MFFFFFNCFFTLHNLAQNEFNFSREVKGACGKGGGIVTKLKLIITDAAVTANKLPVARNVIDTHKI